MLIYKGNQLKLIVFTCNIYISQWVYFWYVHVILFLYEKKTKRRSTHFSHEYDSIIIYTYKLKLRIFVAVTDTLLIEGLNICAENSPDFGWGGRCTIRIYIRLAWEKRFTRNNHIWQSFITSDNVYLFGPNSKTLFIYYIGLNSDYKKIQPKFWL